MTYTTKIDLQTLRSVARFISSDETRYILNGIKVEATTSDVLLIATDGHRLCRHKPEWSVAEGDMHFIIPFAMLDVLKGWNPYRVPLTMLHFNDETQRITIEHNGLEIHAKSIEGNYPAWRQVVANPLPTEFTPGHIRLNPMFLGDTLEVFTELEPQHGMKITSEAKEQGPVYFEAGRTLCVVMQMRRDW